MTVIFVASTDLGAAAHTSGVVRPLLLWLHPRADPAFLEHANFLVRKCGHLSEYALLAALTFRALRLDPRWRHGLPATALACWLCCTAYAATDEFHQSFVPSRTASPGDVLIDSGGAAAGTALLAWRGRRGSARAPAAA